MNRRVGTRGTLQASCAILLSSRLVTLLCIKCRSSSGKLVCEWRVKPYKWQRGGSQASVSLYGRGGGAGSSPELCSVVEQAFLSLRYSISTKPVPEQPHGV